MNENFNDSILQSELGNELGEAVGQIRNSAPDATRVQNSVATMATLIEDSGRIAVNQNRHATRTQSLSNRLSWGGITVLAGLLAIGTFLYFSVPQQVTAAQIARSIAAQDWVRAIETYSNGDQLESWYSQSLNISAISNKERIEYRDHGSGESYEFFHESQTIFRVSESETPRKYSRWSNLATSLPFLLADGLPDDPMNNIPGLDELRERVEFLGHSIEPSEDERELEYAMQCLLDKAPLEIVFVVDAKTKLPVRSIMTGERGGKEVSITIELSYSDDGPESIYNLGVPKTAKLVNRLDSGMGKFLREAVYAGAEDFDDYRAVMVEHRVGQKSWWTGARVEVVCRKGDRFRRAHSRPFREYGPGPDEGEDMHKWWEQQMENAHGGADGVPYNVVVGKEIWRFNQEQDTFKMQRHPDTGFHCWSLRPDMIARPPMGGSAAHLEIRIDENPKTGPKGTILYEIISSTNAYHPVTRKWIDPNQGYLVVKMEMGTDEKWDKQTIVEKAAKSPKGIWYPVRLRSFWHSNDGKRYEDVTNCYVDFETEIPDRLFEVK